MDRKFLMVLERWFRKLSSQNVIGSPWRVHRDIIGKNLNKQLFIIHSGSPLFVPICFHYVDVVLKWSTRKKGEAFDALKRQGVETKQYGLEYNSHHAISIMHCKKKSSNKELLQPISSFAS